MRLAVSAVLIVGIYWPAGLLFLTGASASGIGEESVGYRYFYSLRILHNEHPWIPQGHFAALVHAAIQTFLTATGFPENELFPRVDIFSFVAVAIPALLGLAAAYAVASRMRIAFFIVFVAFSVVIMSGPQLKVVSSTNWFAGGPIWAILPDYHVWSVPMALISIVMLLRVRPTWCWALTLGLVTGIAAGIKPTHAIFPAPAVCMLMIEAGPLRAVTYAILIGAVAMLTFLAALGAYYYQVDLVADHVWRTVDFALTPGVGGVGTALIEATPDLIVVLLMPVACIAVAVRERSKAAAIAGCFGLVSIFICRQRWYSHTMVEMYAFAIVQAAVILVTLEGRLSEQTRRIAAVVSCSIAVLLSWQLVFEPARRLLAYSVGLENAARTWRHNLGSSTLVLVPENAYRPLSIESGLCKGFRNINNSGVSSYVSMLFPNFWCSLTRDEMTARVADSVVGFVRLPSEDLVQAKSRVASHFALDFRDCEEVPARLISYVSCRANKSRLPTSGPGGQQ